MTAGHRLRDCHHESLVCVNLRGRRFGVEDLDRLAELLRREDRDVPACLTYPLWIYRRRRLDQLVEQLTRPVVLARRLIDTAHCQALAQGAPTLGADHAHAGIKRPVDDSRPLLGVEIGFSCHPSLRSVSLRRQHCPLAAPPREQASGLTATQHAAPRKRMADIELLCTRADM